MEGIVKFHLTENNVWSFLLKVSIGKAINSPNERRIVA